MRAQRVFAYMVVAVVAIGVLGTVFVSIVSQRSGHETLTLFLPVVIFTATGLVIAWALLSLSLFVHSRFNDRE